MSKGALYAVTAGFLGALLWAAIAYYMEYELGLLAWGIGAAVGAAMMAGAGQLADTKTGAVALVIALVSIVGGKFFAVEMTMGDLESQYSEDEERVMNDDVYATTYIADAIVEEYNEQGKALNYPAGADYDWPDGPEDYPGDVWAEATAEWESMSEQERADFRTQLIAFNKESREELVGEMKAEGFLSSFSFFDILWFVLGGASAFKLGAGLAGQD